MKANLKQLKKSRIYSEEFKRELVKDFESGRFSVLQLSKLHGVGYVSIYNWIHKFSTFNEKGIRIVEMKNSSSEKLKQLETRVKELEGIIGRKQINIDYLERVIAIANDDLKIDIKKNSNTLQSTGLGNTKKQ